MSAERQSGRTTQQILDAPRDSVYVWCNSQINYPLRLAEYLDRSDIHVVPLSWLRNGNLYDGPLVIDHACNMNEEQYAAFDHIWDRHKAKKGKP